MSRGTLVRVGACAIILALLLTGLVVFAALPSGVTAPSRASSDPSATLGSGRDPYLWPFAPGSIWNLPIGAGAVYVNGQIKRATQAGMTTDPDVLILTPTAPLTPVYQNNDGWSGGSRCSPQGSVLFNGPMPSDFIVPGAGSGYTPNFSTAILMPDNHTLAQGQPMARCTAGGPATMMWYQAKEDLYGYGFSGAHGGSMLSSIGGTIRLGELVPGGVIRHALKVNLYGHDDYYYDATTKGYRWPATTADSYASSAYGGTVYALRMGSLLALPPSLNITAMGLETGPARILAKALQDYGAYTVDDTAWSVYAIETEFGPNGRVEDQFQSAWGFTMTPSSKSTPWSRDMDRLFGNLSVVDNWSYSKWLEVSASNGTEGAGGGAPRAPWAPSFTASSPSPKVTVSSPAAGAHLTPGQQVTVSWSSSGSLQASSVSLSFSADGGSTWGTPFATGQPLNGSSSWSVPNVSTNQSLIRAVAKDTNGNNVEGRSGLFTIQPAAPAGNPTARMTVSPAWPRPGTGVNFDGSSSSPFVASDTLTARWDWENNGAWDTAWSGTLTASHAYASGGTYTARLEVQESSGTTDNATATVNVDGTPPSTTASLQGASYVNGSYVGSVDVTLTASDAMSGVASTAYRVDGGAWQTYLSTFTVAGTGSHLVEFSSTDVAGNVEPTKSAALTIATSTPPAPSPPVTTLTLSGTMGPDGWYVSDVTVTLTATSPSSLSVTVAYRLDGGAWHAYTSPFAVGDGAHTLDYNATDSMSIAEATHTASFKIDTGMPVTTASVSGTKGRDHWWKSAVTVALSASDAMSGVASTAYSLDGGAWQTYASVLTVGSGRHTLEYRSTDVAGLTETATSTDIKVDTSAPHVALSASSVALTGSQATLTWLGTDDLAGVGDNGVSVDGGAYTSVGLNETATVALSDGTHTVRIRVTDNAGNEGFAEVSVRVDTNLFSPTGPYGDLPIIVVLASVLVVASAALLHRRRSASRHSR